MKDEEYEIGKVWKRITFERTPHGPATAGHSSSDPKSYTC